MSRVNPTLKEIEKWLDELPTLEALKQIPGFEIGKAYYFVRIGDRWRIGKDNPYLDAKNLGAKSDNILCFADEPDMNKRIAGKRDCESTSLHTVEIQALKKECNNFDRFLVEIGLKKEFLEFVWEDNPREIYKRQIEEYKKSHNIHVGALFWAFIIVITTAIFLYEKSIMPSDIPTQVQKSSDRLIDNLNSKYKYLPLNKKKLFLQKTDLYTVLEAKHTAESIYLKDVILKYFDRNKNRFKNNLQKDLFLNRLSNEISDV